MRKYKKTTKFYEKFFNFLQTIIDFEYSSVFYFDLNTQKLTEAANTGKTVDLIPEISFKYGYGISGWNAKKKKILIINELDSHNTNRDIKIRSFLSLPLLIEKKLFGIVNFSHKTNFAFSDENVKLLKQISPMLCELLSQCLTIAALKKENEINE
jgi:signal transduction protein with GAF and PtsI domain